MAVHGSMFWRSMLPCSGRTYRIWKANLRLPAVTGSLPQHEGSLRQAKCRLPAATGSLIQHEGSLNRLPAATRGFSKRASTQTCVMVQRYAALIERGEFRSDKRQAGVIRVLSAILSALVDRQPFEGHSAGNASLDARKVKGLYM